MADRRAELIEEHKRMRYHLTRLVGALAMAAEGQRRRRDRKRMQRLASDLAAAINMLIDDGRNHAEEVVEREEG